MKNFIVGLGKVALALLLIFLFIKFIPSIIKFLIDLVVGFFALSTFAAIIIIIVILIVAVVAYMLL